MLNDYLPDPEAEWGHDPHYVELCPGQPDHVWQQNHGGVFYSADGAATWKQVSQPEQGVHFGFPIAVDDEDGRTAWVVPGKSDQQRMAIDGGALRRAHRATAARAGSSCARGCRRSTPTTSSTATRSATAATALAFGSTTGNLYVSEDRGESWRCVANNLPPIYSVRFG